MFVSRKQVTWNEFYVFLYRKICKNRLNTTQQISHIYSMHALLESDTKDVKTTFLALDIFEIYVGRQD